MIETAYRIIILSHGKTINALENDCLAEKIMEAGINLSMVCNKKGVCGKCLVEIIEGKLPPATERERFFQEKNGLNKNYRLACQNKIHSDLVIKIPEESIVQDVAILRTGIRSPVTLNPAVKKFVMKLQRPEIAHPYSITELLENHLKKPQIKIQLSLLKDLPGILESSDYHVTAVLHKDQEILNVEPGDTVERNYGVAVDIGTTTVVLELVDLNTGKSLDVSMAVNSQMKYGSDVISRIGYSMHNPDNSFELKEVMVKSLNEIIKKILDKNKVNPMNVYEIVISGNASMNHFLLEMPVHTLALAPYSSVFTCLPELSAHALGFKINPSGKTYIAPNIKSFVGGDISSGLAAADAQSREGNHLYIDLGTNGEIVLKNQDEFIATSTAAGPAFEGMNISCGMLAAEGAIYKAEFNNELILYTINHKPARGVCGSGLIDLISVFLDEGMITADGRISGDRKKIQINDNLFLTQKDIREFQLAAGAVKSGIRMILQKKDLQLDQLDGLIIAGAFGNYLNVRNSINIGLLPPIHRSKITFIGNASLAGARALLISEPIRKKTEALVRNIHYLSLAADPLFQDYFVNALEFGKEFFSRQRPPGKNPMN